MISRSFVVLLALALASAVGAAAVEGLSALRAADLRLQTIGDRLAIANVKLCRDRQAVTGIVPVVISAYPVTQRAAVAAAFGVDGAVGVEAVVPGSPADKAGIRGGDTLVSIAGASVPTVREGDVASTRDLMTVAGSFGAMPPEVSGQIVIRRKGVDRAVALVPAAGCAIRFELELTDSHVADSDGRIVRLGAPFMDALDDDQLAAVMAHEMAHGVLHHGARLDAAGVDRGLLSAFGRNAREIRLTEDEADRLSVVLLRNAGYDPAAAVRFWRGYGRRIDGGLLRAPTHASSRDRASALDAAAAALPADSAPICPPMLEVCPR